MNILMISKFITEVEEKKIKELIPELVVCKELEFFKILDLALDFEIIIADGVMLKKEFIDMLTNLKQVIVFDFKNLIYIDKDYLDLMKIKLSVVSRDVTELFNKLKE